MNDEEWRYLCATGDLWSMDLGFLPFIFFFLIF